MSVIIENYSLLSNKNLSIYFNSFFFDVFCLDLSNLCRYKGNEKLTESLP